MVQLAGGEVSEDARQPDTNRNAILGLAAVLTAAFSSSFASVHFERILKEVGTRSEPRNLWERNVQLCAWTVPMNGLLALLQSDGLVLFSSPLEGFEWSTWVVIIVNGLGGLLVAVVIKYSDNI